MTSITQTTILEANRLNSIEVKSVGQELARANKADYIVQVPPLVIPKGSTISINMGIINEKGANNDEIIELSDQNISTTHPYISSWQGMEIMFYMNNNAVNSVAMPYIYTNGYEASDADKANLTVGASHNQKNNPLVLNTVDTWLDPADKYKMVSVGDNESNLRFYQQNRQPAGDEDPDPTFITSPSNLRNSLPRYTQDNVKYVYVSPTYQGWWYENKLKPFTKLIQLDQTRLTTSEEGNEDPDQISYNLTNQLHFTNPSETSISTENNVQPQGSRVRRQDAEFLETNLRNMNGATIINIPANGGGFNNEYIMDPNHGGNANNHVIYSNFLVRDINKWTGGDLLLRNPNDSATIGSGFNNVGMKGWMPANLDGEAWGDNSTNEGMFQALTYNNIICSMCRNLNDRFFKFADGNTWISGGSITGNWTIANDLGGNPTVDLPVSYLYMLTEQNTGNKYFMKEISDFSFELDKTDNAATPTLLDPVQGFATGTYSTQTQELTFSTVVNPVYSYASGNNWLAFPPPGSQNETYIFYNQSGTSVSGFVYDGYYQRSIPASSNKVYFKTTAANGLSGISRFDNETVNPVWNGTWTLSLTGGTENHGFITMTGTVVSNGATFTEDFNASADLTVMPSPTFTLAPSHAIGEESGATGNGLPYKTLTGSVGGGYNLLQGGDNINPIEFLAIPDYFVIPTNMHGNRFKNGDASKPENYGTLYAWQQYFRLNERYYGTETDYALQQQDAKNWACDVDVGYAYDYFNALSSMRTDPNDQSGGNNGIRNTSNFAFHNCWQPQSVFSPAGAWTQIAIQQDLIYPIAKFKRMTSFTGAAQHIQSNLNYIRVHSRYFSDWSELVTDNTDNLNDPSVRFVQHESTKILKSWDVDDMSESRFSEYNIAMAPIQYLNGSDGTPLFDPIVCCGLINFKKTIDGTGEGALNYDGFRDGSSNWRTCFRIINGTWVGFDPSATTNNYIIPCNTDQTNVGNNKVQPNGDASVSETNPKIYSSFIEDYANFVWLGAGDCSIQFANSRFQLQDFHTPRLFNAKDSGTGGGGALGDAIAVFNDNVKNHGTKISNTEFPDKNTGINDALSGIMIKDLYVVNEGVEPADRANIDNLIKCYLDTDGLAVNYFSSLLDRLGFKFTDLKPRYGRQDRRYNPFFYDKIDTYENRQSGLNYFTTNSAIDVASAQSLNLFSINQVNIPKSGGGDPITYYGQPEYNLSYLSFQTIALSAQSDILRASNLAQKLNNPFFLIYSDLPKSEYYGNNEKLGFMGVVMKQYKTGDFYFSGGQTYETYLTEDTYVSSIHTQIYNSDGRLATNIGDKCCIFYKVQVPRVLPDIEPPPEKTPEEKELDELNKNVEELIDINQEQDIEAPTASKIKVALENLSDNTVPEYADARRMIIHFLFDHFLEASLSQDSTLRSFIRQGGSRIGGIANRITTRIKDTFSTFNNNADDILAELTRSKNREATLKEFIDSTRSTGTLPTTTEGLEIVKRRKGRKQKQLTPVITGRFSGYLYDTIKEQGLRVANQEIRDGLRRGDIAFMTAKGAMLPSRQINPEAMTEASKKRSEPRMRPEEIRRRQQASKTEV